MKVELSFSTAKDLSGHVSGTSFLTLLASHGLQIERWDDKEPQRKTFSPDMLAQMWRGVGLSSKHCTFLFTGQGMGRFSGMVSWYTELKKGTKYFKGVHLFLTVTKNVEFRSLNDLGDALFDWAEAVYGFVSTQTVQQAVSKPGWLLEYLPAVYWVNYFGLPYVEHPEFRVPDGAATLNHGVRVTLTEQPGDPLLREKAFLDQVKSEIGVQWFGEGPYSTRRVPDFDFSALWQDP